MAAESDSDTTVNMVVGGLVAFLEIVAVTLRFYTTRYFTKAGLGWDDWLILLSLIVAIAANIVILYAAIVDPNGASASSNTDPGYQYTDADILYAKLIYVSAILYYSMTSSTKLSILFMYNRIFSVSRSFRIQALIVRFLVIGFWIGCTLACLLRFIPLKWSWPISHTDSRYPFNDNVFWLASGIVEAFIDVLIIAMPIKIVLGLHLNLTKKVALVGVFLLGIFVIVTGLVKAILSYVPGSREPNFNKAEVWTGVHSGTGIMCACLPVCWPLFVRLSKLRPAFVQKQWHKLGGWSLIEKRGRSTSKNSDLEGNQTSGNGEVFVLDDFSYRRA